MLPLVIVWLAGVYLLVNVRLPRVLPAPLNIYLGQPLTWSTFALLAYMGWRFGLPHRPPVSRLVVSMAFLTGLMQVAIFVLAGLVVGFGRSPYSHQTLAVVGNLLYAASMLIAMEIGRAYLVTLLGMGSPLVAIASVSLLFAYMGIPLAKFTSLVGAEPLFRFSGETLLPAISENLLATFLALSGGPLASLGYRGALELFEWLSPVLPNLHWTLTAFVGTLAPVLGLLLTRSLLQGEPPRDRAAEASTNPSANSWILIALLGVTLLWFNTGLFGVRPTLVSGVSMEPALWAGDIVVTKPVEPGAIRVGDIIRFRGEEAIILHRVVEVHQTDAGLEFVTRGDANNVDDAPISAAQIEGKLLFKIPKLGWLAIGVRRAIELIR
jgi:signal peptidase